MIQRPRMRVWRCFCKFTEGTGARCRGGGQLLACPKTQFSITLSGFYTR